jgi:hypothetical protein
MSIQPTTQETTEEMPKQTISEVKPNVQVIIKQPKVIKEVKEKKELTEGQKKALLKMKEALEFKRNETKKIKMEIIDNERKERENAVKKAEQEAKKISDNVVIEKVRGRKTGTKKPQQTFVRPTPEHVEERRPMTQHEYTIMQLKQRGIYVPDNATPYMIKMILSRLR